MAILEIVRNVILAALLYLLAHEVGHFFFALVLNSKPKFRIQKWRIAVNYQYKHHWQRRLISEAGFGVGMIVGLAGFKLFEMAFLITYWTALCIHFWAYPWTAGESSNDFDGMCSHEGGS